MPEVPVLLLQKLQILETSLEVNLCKDENNFIFPKEDIPPENKWFNGLLEELDNTLSAFLIDKRVVQIMMPTAPLLHLAIVWGLVKPTHLVG